MHRLNPLIHIFILLVFLIGNTGFAVFHHICYTAQTNTYSLWNDAFCATEDAESESCCMAPETTGNEDDCCDEEVLFAKYVPEAIEITLLALPANAILPATLPVYELSNWISNVHTDAVLSALHPPNPNIFAPLDTSDRLSGLQRFLC